MKKVSLTVACILLAGILTAQEYTPTSSMTAAFSAKYPQGLVEEWYDNEDEIVCYFEIEDNFGSAFFTPKGVWTRSEFSQSEDELPKAVSSIILKNYANYEVTDVTKIENTKAITYKIYISNSIADGEYLLTINKDGEILEEEDLFAEE
ncbi:MAG: hypothetical protein ACI837_000507 [Crocinitomicaceae bacterium]|jgi:hypothetical protein